MKQFKFPKKLIHRILNKDYNMIIWLLTSIFMKATRISQNQDQSYSSI